MRKAYVYIVLGAKEDGSEYISGTFSSQKKADKYISYMRYIIPTTGFYQLRRLVQ